MALQQFWVRYRFDLLLAMAGLFVWTMGLWIFLEAYFRGGSGRFWVFAGSSVARLAILSSSAILLGTIAYRGRAGGTYIVGILVFLALAFLVTIAETLIRQDAVELWGSNLAATAAVMGVCFTFEALTLAVAGSITAALMLTASRPVEFAAAGLLAVVLLMIWSVFHSYLLVVRYSTIDIMRQDVRGV
jgi:hypothetical protein